MVKFKRQKLFSSIVDINKNNFFYEETWVCSIQYFDKGKITLKERVKNFLKGRAEKDIHRYRVKYQRYLAADYNSTTSSSEVVNSKDSSYEPTVLCFLETWDELAGWIKCLEMPIDANTNYLICCKEINGLYQSFRTGVALKYDSEIVFEAPENSDSDISLIEDEDEFDLNLEELVSRSSDSPSKPSKPPESDEDEDEWV